MGQVLVAGGAGIGVSSDDCTAPKKYVLEGYQTITSDSDDEIIEGTMKNNGAQSGTLKCGESKTIPEGYTTGGTVTAASLASQTDATATSAYVYKDRTFWAKGVKYTGTMTVSSVLSFSVAAYSTSQILCTWKNPAKGPFSGVVICAKTGGYPTSKDDNRKYTGTGSNSSANGTSSTTISGLTAGTTYYVRIWYYATCSAGNIFGAYSEKTVTTTTSGRKAFTSSGTWTVPANVRSISVHCVNGGYGGAARGATVTKSGVVEKVGHGGNGGHVDYKTDIAVTPGQIITVVVGAGGNGGNSTNQGGQSSVSIGSNVICAPSRSGSKYTSGTSSRPAQKDGSGGGGWVYSSLGKDDANGAAGGSNGGNGSGKEPGTGQGTTTREFGLSSGTLYAGGGGGFAASGTRPPGGSGGGGAGGGWNLLAVAGTAGTGGGGGGGGYYFDDSSWGTGANGGSGCVIIKW